MRLSMKSWTDWVDLSAENVRAVPEDAKGVYVIRKKGARSEKESDIIYIGQSGKGRQGVANKRQGVGKRLTNLVAELKSSSNKGNNHSAGLKIKEHLKNGLQFSWIECVENPDGVEKALLLAFFCSAKKLPVCNNSF